MYLVVHRRTFLWGVLVAACCLLLPFLGGVAATSAATPPNGGEATNVVTYTVTDTADFSEF